MTKDELRAMISEVVEQTLLEILGDPDDGLEVRETVRARLLRQSHSVGLGERGIPLDDIDLDNEPTQLVEKNGLLVAHGEPLADLQEFVQGERQRRQDELMDRLSS
jgi:hypothetical protein